MKKKDNSKIGRSERRVVWRGMGGRIKLHEEAIGCIVLTTLTLLTLSLICPTAIDTTYAEEPSKDTMMTTSVNTNTVALVRSSIAVAMSSNIGFDIIPKAGGTFSTSEASLKVTTNNTTGYSVYLQTIDNTSKLNPVNPEVSMSINKVEGSLTSTNYQSKLNSWGYKLGSATTETDFVAIPQAGDPPIVRTEGVSREDDYTLAFAVATSADLPAGIYKNELVASVVANPIEVRSLNDIEFMQEMTPEICTISYIDETKQLIDTRDGKSYWVAKLKDGNCWMTQNLALDIALDDNGNAAALSESGQKVTLDESNSDMRGKWGSESQYPPSETKDALGASDDNMAKSWKLTAKTGETYSFYQFMTATAGVARNSNYTICPKGWTLPVGSSASIDGTTFGNLFSVYDISSKTNNVGEVLQAAPFNFTFGGRVEINESEERWQSLNDYGFYWTRTVPWSGVGDALMFRMVAIVPSHTAAIQGGFALRCVVR